MVNQAADNTHWIDAWLETQRGWLGRWQSVSLEQRTDAMRVGMDTLRAQLDPAGISPEAVNVVQSFQALLQSCMAGMGEMARLQSEGQAGTPWQQMLQAFPLGPAREQQAAWQEYAQALADYQVRLQLVLYAFGKVFTQSLEAVPALAAQRAEQGRPVQGFRELYELWIECGEQAFAAMAHDQEFIAAQAASGNALSRLKRAQQALIEYWLKSHDLPTRSELNSVHLRLRALTARVAELEQQLAAQRHQHPGSKPSKPVQD
ncbi:MAG: poly(R)-hydroxyalkanoic acid synthase subunit PhaE [Steroidobacteraceae bacterium]